MLAFLTGIDPKRAIIGGAILLCVLGFIGWLKLHDHKLVSAHDDYQAVQAAKVDHKADEQSSNQRTADTNRLNNEQTQLQKVEANAPNDLERRRARFACIRLQQAARSNGQLAPDCQRPSVSAGTARP